MELQLKNIGMIKEANVKIDGLTVIAGENDTGKTTVAKALYHEIIPLRGLGSLNRYLSLGEAEIKPNNVILIDTPNSLDTFSFIKNSTLLIHQKRLNIHLPEYRIDLILKLSQDILEEPKDSNLYQNIESLIGGKVFFDKSKDNIYYEKYSLKNQKFKMEDTSNGIKMFGFLQILLLNGTLKEGVILILDEPEVHLHPKWQLKYAELIVQLIKNGVKILVNSHSPYMIEALKRYSEVEKIDDNTNFYLAEGGYIEHQESLEGIFEKLAEPMRELKELKWQSLKKN